MELNYIIAGVIAGIVSASPCSGETKPSQSTSQTVRRLHGAEDGTQLEGKVTVMECRPAIEQGGRPLLYTCFIDTPGGVERTFLQAYYHPQTKKFGLWTTEGIFVDEASYSYLREMIDALR